MNKKKLCLPFALSMQILIGESSAAEYCGVVNGIQVWNELAPSTCADALSKMQLSKEHLDSSQKGRAVEKRHSSYSSTAIENTITSVGDYLQKGADERADAERAERDKMYAAEEEEKQTLIAKLSNHILADYPEERIRNADCKSQSPGLGVLEKPKFDSETLKEAFGPMYDSTLPQLYTDIKNIGKVKFLSEAKSQLSRMQGDAYDSFQEAVLISSEVRIKYIQEGDQSPIDCNAGLNNANTCKYIFSRYTADFLTTLIALTEKCVR